MKADKMENLTGIQAPVTGLAAKGTAVLAEYFFKTRNYYEVIETCKVRNDGTMIGSVKCQQCEFNKGSNMDIYGEISFIKCEKIEEAI